MIVKVHIGDLGEIVTGNTPPRNKPEYYGSYAPFIKATDIDETSKYTYAPEECYSELGYQKYRKSLIPKGSTCVVTIGSIGRKMTMAHCDCFINQAMNAIIPSANYDSEYVYYVIKHNVQRLKALDSGTASGRENVSKSAFSNLEIYVIDDIEIQRKIGSVLAAYDDLIENNQKQIKLLEEAAQRLYKEWFIDLRFPGHETTPIVDGIPEGWEEKAMMDICDSIGGGTPSTKVDEYYRGGKIRWVTPTDITRNIGLILLDTEKKITEEGFRNSSAKMVPPYTILMTSRASVGFFGLCEHEVCTNQGFISCVPYQENIRFYLLHNLMSRVDEIRAKASGSTFLEISKKTFRDLRIILPSDCILEVFNKQIWPVVRQMEMLTKSIVKLREARDRLLPKLMSGEIEV